MRLQFTTPVWVIALACVPLAACDQQGGGAPKTEEAREAAGDNTLSQMLGSDDSSFAGAAKAAGLDTTLAGPGPYTIFVPTNAAFQKLPAGTMENMQKPEARAQLTKLLSNHILSGSILAEDIGKAIDNGKGKTQLMTIGGGTLTATKAGDKIVLTDEAGGKATVAGADGKASNGVLHHVDGVLMPK